MSLSCSCDYDPEPGDVCWYEPNDYGVFDRKRSVKCCSCGDKVRSGDLTIVFERYKVPAYDIEIGIYGEDGEVPMASWYMCERCGDLFFSLKDLGYCIDIREDMRGLVREYAEMNRGSE